MTRSLTASQVEAYERDGVLFPLPAIGAAGAARGLERLAEVEAREGGRLSRRTNQKPHLLLPWLNELVRDERILDTVEDLLGPDLLCWSSGFFTKRPGDGAFVSWHQDSTYWGLSTPDVLTAWIAFSPSTTQSGCMRVVPGTHRIDQLPHADTFAADNLLSRGQEIAVAVEEEKAIDVVLQPGEMSLHHVRLVHGSKANQANHARVGFTIRYVPTHVRQLSGVPDSATLVRGQDRYGHFEPEPVPRVDFDPDCVAFHKDMIERHTKILYAGAAQVRVYDGPPAPARAS